VSDHRGGDITAAIIARLEAASLLVGDGEAPASGGWSGSPGQSTFVGYVDVHPIAGGDVDGTLAAPNSDAAPDYQLISVGATRAQAEFIGDDVREAMLSTALTDPSGRSIALLRIDMLGGCIRDDTVQPAVFMVSDRYRVLTVPA
jgi:hypothetical protein